MSFHPDRYGKYFGFTQDGMKNGLGLYIGARFEYEGMFENDSYNGIGRLTTSDTVYEGEFADNECNGVGMIEDKHGVFIGECAGKMEPAGLGEFISRDSIRYRGVINGWRLDGYGELLDDTRGKKYIGEFNNGVKDGVGEETTKAGFYRGGFLDGKRDGSGVFEAEDWRYEGGWRKGCREGIGIYREGKLRYVGMFEADQKNGFGKLEDDVSTYIGGFDNDLKNGIGYLQMDKKSSYFGQWVDDQRHGLGILINGDRESKAQWENDELHGLCYTTGQNMKPLFQKYVRGKLHHVSPAQHTLSSFLEEVAVTLPKTFFQFSLQKIQQMVPKPPQLINRLELEKVLVEVKKIKLAYENGELQGRKDRRELRAFLTRRGVSFEGQGKSWALEEFKGKPKNDDKWSPAKASPESGKSKSEKKPVKIVDQKKRTKKGEYTTLDSNEDEDAEKAGKANVVIGESRKDHKIAAIPNDDDDDQTANSKSKKNKEYFEDADDKLPPRVTKEKLEQLDRDYEDYKKAKEEGRVGDYEEEGRRLEEEEKMLEKMEKERIKKEKEEAKRKEREEEMEKWKREMGISSSVKKDAQEEEEDTLGKPKEPEKDRSMEMRNEDQIRSKEPSLNLYNSTVLAPELKKDGSKSSSQMKMKPYKFNIDEDEAEHDETKSKEENNPQKPQHKESIPAEFLPDYYPPQKEDPAPAIIPKKKESFELADSKDEMNKSEDDKSKNAASSWTYKPSAGDPMSDLDKPDATPNDEETGKQPAPAKIDTTVADPDVDEREASGIRPKQESKTFVPPPPPSEDKPAQNETDVIDAAKDHGTREESKKPEPESTADPASAEKKPEEAQAPADPPKEDPPKVEPPKEEPAKSEPPKEEPLKSEPPKAEPSQPDSPKADPVEEPKKETPAPPEPPKQDTPSDASKPEDPNHPHAKAPEGYVPPPKFEGNTESEEILMVKEWRS